MAKYSSQTDPELWLLLQEGDCNAFKELHNRHFQILYQYAMVWINDKQLSLNILQELFFWIWSERQHLTNEESVPNYLMESLMRDIKRALDDQHRRAYVFPIQEKKDYPYLSVKDKLTPVGDEPDISLEIRKAV